VSSHDLTLFALGGAFGAYVVLLAGLLLSLHDDKRRSQADLAALPAKSTD
jgi:hypothetical protein